MAFECNIEARGKAHRMKLGIRLVIISIILAALTFFDILPSTLGWILTGGSFVGGAFTIWESRMGWCVVRAMGFKTRI
ncbi:MAG: hypothetical protein HOB52_05375 [Euryarchaeota archaeon]|jgi:hypothetical protein|nr:hypothetical protein [Euryarchaeota archaeon]MBT4407467.1 hypothetical protein [Euryarchaeota archaeon]MBT6645215.1 hypothetical protein [Euryarchaeota archaeon]